MIIKDSLVSTGSQVLGRLANFGLPLLLVSKYEPSEESDFFFLAFSIIFFFGSTLSNAATDAFVSYIKEKTLCQPARAWFHICIGLAGLSFVFIVFSSYQFGIYELFISIVSMVLVWLGLITSFYVSKLYIWGDYFTPGVTWSIRWMALIPILLFDDFKICSSVFLLFYLFSDLLRLNVLSRRVKSFEMNISTVRSKSIPVGDVALFMFSSSLSGMNPLVDRFVAGTLVVGSVTQLELIDRLSSLFFLIPTIGLFQVLNVEISRVLNSGKKIQLDRILGGVFLFSVVWCSLSFAFFLMGTDSNVENYYSRFGLPYLDREVIEGVGLLLATGPALFVGMFCVRVLLASKKAKCVSKVSGFSLIVNIVLSLVFSELLGLKGVLIATLFTYSFTAIILIVLSSRAVQKDH